MRLASSHYALAADLLPCHVDYDPSFPAIVHHPYHTAVRLKQCLSHTTYTCFNSSRKTTSDSNASSRTELISPCTSFSLVCYVVDVDLARHQTCRSHSLTLLDGPEPNNTAQNCRSNLHFSHNYSILRLQIRYLSSAGQNQILRLIFCVGSD